MTDLTIDISRMPEPGETLDATRFAVAPGGKGANQAVALANLGDDVMFVGCVGDDAFGRAARENFDARGIDSRHVRVMTERTSGVAPIFVEPSGENRILIVRGANDALTAADVSAATADIAACDMLLVQLEIPLDAVYAAYEIAARAAVPVIVNPAPASTAFDVARVRGAAYVIPNETELALLANRTVDGREETIAAARAVIARGVKRVIVTLGAQGALFVEATAERHVPAVPVAAVDTTGAGDAFIGGLTHALVAGIGIDAALAFATRYAADSVTKRGTQSSFATRAEIAAP